MKRELGIARCGLACCLCSENITCKGCKRDGFMELSWCKDAEWYWKALEAGYEPREEGRRT